MKLIGGVFRQLLRLLSRLNLRQPLSGLASMPLLSFVILSKMPICSRPEVRRLSELNQEGPLRCRLGARSN